MFYSLRHSYATLAKQMGNSVVMIEKHYSHLKVVQAIEQLRGEETSRLIAAGSVVDAEYASKRVTKVKQVKAVKRIKKN